MQVDSIKTYVESAYGFGAGNYNMMNCFHLLLSNYTGAITRLYKKAVFAYGKGMYEDAGKWCEVALAETEPRTQVGGNIQLYQALSFDACGQQDLAGTMKGT